MQWNTERTDPNTRWTISQFGEEQPLARELMGTKESGARMPQGKKKGR
jgi:hypothetical protein